MESERKHNEEHNKDQLAASLSETLHVSNEPDRDVIQAILDFTILLLDKCANRSLYASSDRLNHLLNTTSLPLLKITLRLSFRLARRCFFAMVRSSSQSQIPAIREGYNLSSQRLHVLALPADPLTSPPQLQSPGKNRERGHRKRSRSVSEDSSVHPWDLSTILNGEQESGELRISFGSEDLAQAGESEPPSPLARRTSSMHAANEPESPLARRTTSMYSANDAESSVQQTAQRNEFVISFTELRDEDIHITMKRIADQQPSVTEQYKALCRLREAKAMVSRDERDRLDLVAIRLLSLANFSFTQEESSFRQLIANPLSEHPRHYHLPQLIVGLVQPPESGTNEIDRDLQTYALYALESLSIHKGLGFNMDVYYALGANVNHGILFYLVRKAVSQLSEPESQDDNVTIADEEWREALFELLRVIPITVRSAAESLNQAGILEILNQVLQMRSSLATKTHWRILHFLDSFVQSARESLQTYINIHGLDVMKDLVAYTVEDAVKLVKAGSGMPEKYQSHVTDYLIPFFHQCTLRWSFRIFNRLMSTSNTTFNRQLRNLFDSRPMLQSLEHILKNPPTFGSVVWSSAVNFLSSFLNNEPTSYSIIAEAGLNEAFLTNLEKRVPLEELKEIDDETPVRKYPEGKDQQQSQILPLSESILAVPNGIGALCLNEAGLKYFQKSDSIARFLDIFQSPPHVETLVEEQTGARKLGQLFDELVRHHPHETNGLKIPILNAVLRMMENVDQRCRIEAYNYGYGGKAVLNKPNEPGSTVQGLVVAGGKKSLRGIDPGLDRERMRYRQDNPARAALNGTNGDIDMDEEVQDGSLDVSDPNPEVDYHIVYQNDSKMKIGSATSMICAVVKFLDGFCHGSATRRSFIELGGVERLLDLLTSPCHDPAKIFSDHPYTLMTLYTDSSRLLYTLIDEQPFIVIPAILHRLQIALDVLSPVIKSDSEQGFFAPFTTPSGDDLEASHVPGQADLQYGTFYVKALTVVEVLTYALAYAFKEPSTSPRQTSNVFQTCNFADLYIDVTEKLGKLSRSLVWESVALESIMPEDWKHGGLKNGMNPWIKIETAESILENMGYPQPIPNTTTIHSKTNAQYHNASILRPLYSKIPSTIGLLFHNMGRLLLARRTNDAFQKQAALKIADQIALSLKDMLEFSPARTIADDKMRYSYWVCVLRMVVKVFLDGEFAFRTSRIGANFNAERVSGNHPLTLLLLSFKNQDGFDGLEFIVDNLYEDYEAHQDQEPSSDSLQDYRLGGMKLILQLFANIIDSRQMADASQTGSLQSSRSSDKDKLDYFTSGQFLVELRLLAMHAVGKMWPNFVKENEPYKPLMRVVRLILEGEGEAFAFKRSDKIVQKGKTPAKLWSPRNTETLSRLQEMYGDELAREALFRCYDGAANATLYCAAYSRPELRNKRNPVPLGEMQTPGRAGNTPLAPLSAIRSSLANSARESPEPRREASESVSSSMNAENNEGDSPSNVPAASTPDIFAGFGSGPDLNLPDFATLTASLGESRSNSAVILRTPPTVDDLEEKRNLMRENLIENLSTVLAERDDVNFELKDLITAASQSESWVNDTDPAAQIIAMFQSLADSIDDASSTEEANKKAKHIGTITHFMALVLQDPNLYKDKRDSVCDCLNQLLGLLDPRHSVTNYSEFAPQVLLMLEMILSDDSQPVKIKWKSPKAEDPIRIEKLGPEEPEQPRILELGDEYEDRSTKLDRIMSAVLSMVPHVKGDEAFALSVSRVLTALTRNRRLALRLSKKDELKKFFGMIRQLSTMSELLQSCIIIILRHVIEDDDTIRQVMRSEIESYFRNSSRTPRIDTTQWTKQFYNLVLRAPDLFVNVTNELVQIHKWDPNKSTHYLELKKDFTSSTDTGKENNHSDSSASEKNDSKSKSKENETVPTAEDAKDEIKDQPELKMPILEDSEGLIGFMLQELLSIKDDEDDTSDTTKSNEQNNGDVEMTGNNSLQPGAASPTATSDVAEPSTPKLDEKPFKPQEHPNYIYRSFLLQSMTELLSSYNKAKVEFISYKCRIDLQGTPSKPRAAVFKYLLSNLIPVGTLAHESSVAFKKREATSQCAIFLLNGLVTKTFEKGPYNKHGDDGTQLDLSNYVEEPELLYVRHFVVDQCLRVLKEAMEGSESLDIKYSRLMKIADLFNRMLTFKPTQNALLTAASTEMSQKMLAKIMYEKGLIHALTTVLGEIDLKFTGAKRLVKYILRPLKHLTELANDLSVHPIVQNAPDLADDDEDDLFTDELDEAYLDAGAGPNIQFSSIEMYRPDEDEEDVDMDSDEDDEDVDGYGDEEDYDEEMDFEDVVNGNENISDEEIDHDIHEDLDLDGGSEMDVDDDNLDDMSDDEDDEDDEDITSEESDEDEDVDEDEAQLAHEIGEAIINGHAHEDWGSEEDDEDEDVDYDAEQEVLSTIDAIVEQEMRDQADEMANAHQQQDNVNHFTIEHSLDEAPPLVHASDIARAADFLDNLTTQGGTISDIADVQVIDEDEMDEDEDDYDEEEDEGLIYHAGEDGMMRHSSNNIEFLTRFLDDDMDDWDINPRHGRARQGGSQFPGAIWGTSLRFDDRGGWSPLNNSSRTRQSRARTGDEGINPLLRPQSAAVRHTMRRQVPGDVLQAPPPFIEGGLRQDMDVDMDSFSAVRLGHHDFGMSFLNNLMHLIQHQARGHFPHDHITLTIDGQPFLPPGRGHLRANWGGRPMSRHHLHHHHHHYHHHHDLSHHNRNDPSNAIRFDILSTVSRWTEEARILFAGHVQEKAQNVVPSLLRLLVPPARQRQKEEEARVQREREEAEERVRKEKEEQERVAKEKKEREEQEAKEEAEREAREAVEAAEAAFAAAAASSAEIESSADVQVDNVMEGVESSIPEQATESSSAAGPSATDAQTERVMYRLGDREIDITSLGIDPSYLDELPDDLREEVLMGQVVQQRANAASTGNESTEFDQEFLAALPPEMREEVLQAELMERRRREREDSRRTARSGAGRGGPTEMDPASFFASLQPGLREQVLAEQDEETIVQLPPDLQAEARRLGAGRQRLPVETQRQGFTNPRILYNQDTGTAVKQSRPHQYVQFLDKAGVAALLRLMFMAQSGSAKQSLYDILFHACQNKQNRADILSTLLSILQDGSSDVGSVERSFAQLSSRAKPPSSSKTPQKRSGSSVSAEMTPLTIMDQCLHALFSLIQNHSKVMEFMLSEHEVSIGFKSRSARKGKAKESKASRYPINALLGLLDRKSIIENSVVMESLTAVLHYMTNALSLWEKKKKEIELKEKEEAEAKAKAEADAEKATSAENENISEEQQQQPSTEEPTTTEQEQPSGDAEESAEPVPESTEKAKKMKMPPAPPEVSEHNLRLVVSIFAARECTSKTFKSTLFLISNLSTIPKAKAIFGEELMRLAQELGSHILDDLKQLLVQVKSAESATDVLRVALSKFSPANSDQAKLLRVITCLDYISDSSDPKLREMFENETFSPLWYILSQCLTAIREHGNMMNVATILLPLIEVLMVVCRSPTMKAAEQPTSMEMSISSLPETSPMESLFYKFTDEHKKILNDLVRQNPKLMSGSFSLLVKNSKILEFDNKREHFARKLKTKSQTEMHTSYPALGVNVKRSSIFHDSYRSLYYKKPEEIKFGKLNVKFIGEEAVDAGGVTREWFHELIKQIFNPNYVLFRHIASDRTTFHPNESSGVNQEHLSFFKFIGNVIGKAVFESRHLDCHFSQAVYKRILGKPVGVKDMEAHDPTYYKSLVWILENDVNEQDMTFSREFDEFGVTKIVDLIEQGRNIKVTNENKREYVSLIVHHLLVSGVEEQLDNLIKGKSYFT